MIRTYSVVVGTDKNGADTWAVRFYNVPRWAALVQKTWTVLCALSRGVLGGHPPNDRLARIMWSIPLGRRRYVSVAGIDVLDNSLAERLNSIETKIIGLYGEPVLEVELFVDEAEKLNPDLVAFMKSEDTVS